MDMHPEVIGNDRYALPPQLFFDGGEEIYCSPWCGGGCKRAAYDKAVADAAALAQRMGDGWEPVVWENLGWYYRIEKGVAELYPPRHVSGSISYSVIFRMAICITASAETPEDAFGFAVQDARGREREIAADLEAIGGSCAS